MRKATKKLKIEENQDLETKLKTLEKEKKFIAKTITALKSEIRTRETAKMQRKSILIGKYLKKDSQKELLEQIISSDNFKAFIREENAEDLFDMDAFDGDEPEKNEDVSGILDDDGYEKKAVRGRKKKLGN